MDLVLTNTNCSNKTIPMVSLDYKKAAYDITKEMIQRGNKKIWLITTIRKYIMNDLKVDGYLKAMNEYNLEPKVIKVSGKTELNEVSYKELLEEDHPDVAIVVRDSMAVSLINVARLLHIHLPNEMQVIGFQNTRYAELARPKLTSIETPIYEIGDRAMELLTNLMENNEEGNNEINKRQYIDYQIVWRDSTKEV